MAGSFVQYFYCFVVLSVCIDQGDGRWKKRDAKQNLRHDIDVFRKMADKIEHEIGVFYDEYPEERLKVDNIERFHYKYVQDTLNRDTPTKEVNKQDGTISQKKNNSSNKNNNNISEKYGARNITVNKTDLNNHVSFKDVSNKVDTGSKWPKFEDILLEMGKRYDWKNDRWIKVKEKLKVLNKVNVIQNDVDFHEKHKFSYRIVKLNRNKRRNVVVAVSAVR